MNWALTRLRAEGPHWKHKGHMTSRYEARIYFLFSESTALFLFYKVQHQLHILLCHLGRELFPHMKSVALKDILLLIQQCHWHNLLSHLGSFLFLLREISSQSPFVVRASKTLKSQYFWKHKLWFDFPIACLFIGLVIFINPRNWRRQSSWLRMDLYHEIKLSDATLIRICTADQRNSQEIMWQKGNSESTHCQWMDFFRDILCILKQVFEYMTH